MAAGDDIPNHLNEDTALDEPDFLLSSYTQAEVTEIHTAVANLPASLRENTGGTRYLILGNYDSPAKQRLTSAKQLLETYDPNSTAFLLEDIDPDNTDWDNFYLKFRYTQCFVDYFILIAEDNDGGHELELGELELSKTWIIKRDYTPASIDNDLEYAKYDAMMAKLCAAMDRRGHLYHWTNHHEFARALKNLAHTNSNPSSLEPVDPSGDDPLSSLPDETPEDETRTEESGNNWDPPAEWEINERTTLPVESPPPKHEYVIHYDRDEVAVKLRYADGRYTLERTIRTDGGIANNRIKTSLDPDELVEAAREFTHKFNTNYSAAPVREAVENTVNELDI
jgi:hypothetical protein